jgi:ParB family chromosome partitioning protein
MANRRRPSMSDRLGGASDDNVTPITRGRDAFSAAPAPVASDGSPVEISVELIDPSPDNPRSDLGNLKEMAESIRQVGVLQPLQVRPNGDRFALIYGHRRLAAAKLAKRATVPVFFAPETDEAADHTRRLVENLHREDLTPLDEAKGYQQLLALGVSGGQRGLAKLVGKSQSHISKRLALLELPEDVQAHVDSGRITPTDAVELSKLSDEPERLQKAVKVGLAYGGSSLTHQVKRELAAREREADQQRQLAELRAAGVAVVDDPRPYNREDGPIPLTWLHWVDADEHAGTDCHAVTPTSYGSGVTPLCLNPQAHPDPTGAAEDEERARQAAEARAEQEARLQARKERWAFAAGLVAKGSPADGATLAVHQCLAGDSYLRVDDEAVAELLDLKPDTFHGKDAADAVKAYAVKGSRNAQRAVYAIAVALAETSLRDPAYYGETGSFLAHRAYFDHLVAAGYSLSRFDEHDLAEIDEALAEFTADDDNQDGDA